MCHANSRSRSPSPSISRWSAIRRCAPSYCGRPDIGQPDWRHDAPRQAATPLSEPEIDDIVCVSGQPAKRSASNRPQAIASHIRHPTGGQMRRDRKSSPRAATAATAERSRAAATASNAARQSPLVSRRWLLFKAASRSTVSSASCSPFLSLRYLFAPWRKDASFNSWISLGPVDYISHRRNAPRLLQKSFSESVGRPDRQRRLLRAPRRRQPVPGLRHQLRAPGLPGALVPAVAAVHVPVPRRRLLRRRLACFRAAGARPIHLQLAKSYPASCRSMPAKCRRSRTPRSWSRFRPARRSQCSG